MSFFASASASASTLTQIQPNQLAMDMDMNTVITTPMVMTTSTSTSYASLDGDIIDKHHRAIGYLQDCLEFLKGIQISRDSIVTSGISEEIRTYLENFKSHKLNIQEIIILMYTLNLKWNEFQEIANEKNVPKIQDRKKVLSCDWNKALNKLRGRLVETSCLNDLLFINGHHGFYQPTQGEPRKFTDIQSLDKCEKTDVRVHLSEGRIFAPDNKIMCSRLLGFLELVNCPKDLVIHQNKEKLINWVSFPVRAARTNKPVNFGIWIGVQWSDPETGLVSPKKISQIYSNEPKFLQHFLGGNFPGYPKIKQMLCKPTPEDFHRYPLFYQLARCMKFKIYELIEASGREPEKYPNISQYTVIRCPRTEPRQCGCESVITKPSTRNIAYKCVGCTMELCPWGCGRIHHGGPCNLPPDEASADLIAKTTKICPGCRNPVHKIEGCNHIKCRCGVEFCYLCGLEYNIDNYGHYQVTEHYQDLDNDGRPRCRQFDMV
jgi:hypothetical protein